MPAFQEVARQRRVEEQPSEAAAFVTRLKPKSFQDLDHLPKPTSLYAGVGGAFWSNGNELSYGGGLKLRW